MSPYVWKAVLRDGGVVGSGDLKDAKENPILSPMFVPTSLVRQFIFAPIDVGYRWVKIDLAENEQLDFVMTRQQGGVGGPIQTLAVAIGKRNIHSKQLIERKFYFSDGRVISFMGSFDQLEPLLKV
jgi:hypothetical protein